MSLCEKGLYYLGEHLACASSPLKFAIIIAMTHIAMQGQPSFEAFNPFTAQPKMSYKDGYQQRYFVLDSFRAGAQQLKAYCDTLPQPPKIPDPNRYV